MNILVFDTETTGVHDNKKPITHDDQPYIVQLAAILGDEKGNVVSEVSIIIEPDGWSVPTGAASVHGVPTEKAERYGIPISIALHVLLSLWRKADVVVGHNIPFDIKMVKRYYKDTLITPFDDQQAKIFDTMIACNDICKIPLTEKQRNAKEKWPNLNIPDYKNPTLQESYTYLFNDEFEGAHNALDDVKATYKVYQECKNKKNAYLTMAECMEKR